MCGWRYYEYSKARIKHKPFKNEKKFIFWKLNNPSSYKSFDFQTKQRVISPFKLKKILEEAKKAKIKISFLDFKILRYEEQIKALERLIGELRWKDKKGNYWKIKKINQLIIKTKRELEIIKNE